MDCRDVRSLLNAYSDGELDLVRHLQAEHHLAECTECAEREQGLRALRDAIASAPLYHRAPDALRRRVLAAPEPVRPATGRRAGWSVVPVAAGLAAAAAVLLTAGVILLRPSPSTPDRVTDQVLVAHIRSLQADHLTDVASSDRHTVKPWFRGQLDFSPTVPDLAPQGFPLTGGRLDYVADRPVAALVYLRRQHVINVFVWPAPGTDVEPARRTGRQGFHLVTWHQAGMAYWAVSDLNPEELDAFATLVHQSSGAVIPFVP